MLYAAPEVIRGTRYDEKCDVYSFSMILVALIEQSPDLFELFSTVYRQSGLYTDEDEDDQTTDTSHHRLSRGGRRITVHMLTNAIISHNLRPKLRETVVESLRYATLFEFACDSMLKLLAEQITHDQLLG